MHRDEVALPLSVGAAGPGERRCWGAREPDRITPVAALVTGTSRDARSASGAVTGHQRGGRRVGSPYPTLFTYPTPKGIPARATQALYVTMFPCCECAKLLIQAGIREVVYFEDKAAPARPASASLSGIRCCIPGLALTQPIPTLKRSVALGLRARPCPAAGSRCRVGRSAAAPPSCGRRRVRAPAALGAVGPHSICLWMISSHLDLSQVLIFYM